MKWEPQVFPNRVQEINTLSSTTPYPVPAQVYPNLQIRQDNPLFQLLYPLKHSQVCLICLLFGGPAQDPFLKGK